MVRSVPLLISAMLLSRPEMPPQEAQRYARALNEAARAHDFDPLTAVAIIHHESRWMPGVVSQDGEDFGLGQVRARFVGACRNDDDPKSAPSEACRAVKASLLDGANNIRHMASIITANRDFCKERTGTALAPQWLAGYQGYSSPGANRWCHPGEKTWEVLAYRQQLITALVLHHPASKAKGGPVAGVHAPGATKVAEKALPVGRRAKPKAKVTPAPARAVTSGGGA